MWLAELSAHLSNVFRILLFQGSSLHTSNYLRKSLTIYTLTGSDLDDDAAPHRQTAWSKKPNSLGGWTAARAASLEVEVLCGEGTEHSSLGIVSRTHGYGTN